MSAEKCLRIYLNPSSEAESFCFLPLLNIFDSTTLCTDMSFYICDVCCVNWKVLVDESGFLKQHAVYPVQPVAEGQGPAPLSTWLSSSAAGCLLLFSFSKRLNAFTKNTEGFGFDIPLLDHPMQYSLDSLQEGCCILGFWHQFHRLSFVTLVPK